MEFCIKGKSNICDIIKNEILNTKSDTKALTNIKRAIVSLHNASVAGYTQPEKNTLNVLNYVETDRSLLENIHSIYNPLSINKECINSMINIHQKQKVKNIDAIVQYSRVLENIENYKRNKFIENNEIIKKYPKLLNIIIQTNNEIKKVTDTISIYFQACIEELEKRNEDIPIVEKKAEYNKQELILSREIINNYLLKSHQVGENAIKRDITKATVFNKKQDNVIQDLKLMVSDYIPILDEENKPKSHLSSEILSDIITKQIAQLTKINADFFNPLS
ncbi:hypothetical protein I5E97_15285 [Proteus hauseri]|uniref:hypothetical protein n=1 Tax=Proteus cibi TaxID=2050966 RepID=UPI000D69D230|nr:MULTISPECIES: hypothetical protein [Proteus]MBG6032398.1 hypothetical protein [Proteus hauseri]